MDFYEQGAGVEHNIIAQISSNLRSSGNVAGWYSLGHLSSGCRLDANLENTVKVNPYYTDNDGINFKIVGRDNDGWFSLYNRKHKGFLDASSGIRIKKSYDRDINDFARWRLVPIPGHIWCLVENRAKLNEGSEYRYLNYYSSNSNSSLILYSDPKTYSAWWRFVRTSWD